MSTFSQHYHEELSYLREALRELAEKNPTQAAMLRERGADPDMERLIQAGAFLNARLREQIENNPS